MKKLQKSIFFCLGDPNSIQELVLYRINSSNPLYGLLFSLQNIIGYWIQKILSFEIIKIPEILSDAKEFFNFTKIFIKIFIEDEISPCLNTFPDRF